jgi:hypothetical protein
MDRLLELLEADKITTQQYDRMYTFLDHARVGMAERLYGRVVYLRRAAEARSLGLEVPGMEGRPDDDLVQELDVRAMLSELSLAF